MRQFNGDKFRRQQAIGNYIVDFICLEKKLIIEADGGQHLENPDDIRRTHWLESRGYRVLRFWNNQIFNETGAVLKVIWDALGDTDAPPHLSPPPPGGKKV